MLGPELKPLPAGAGWARTPQAVVKKIAVKNRNRIDSF
jgi:hypothetical protein